MQDYDIFMFKYLWKRSIFELLLQAGVSHLLSNGASTSREHLPPWEETENILNAGNKGLTRIKYLKKLFWVITYNMNEWILLATSLLFLKSSIK